MHNALIAHGADLVAPERPTNDKPLAVAAAQGSKHHARDNPAIVPVVAGRLADGRWRVSRWNLQRELADADAVRAFLAAAGVRA